MRTAVFTIVAKNYWPFARVLMSLVGRWSPAAQRIVVLVDHPDGFLDPKRENFDVIQSEELPIPESRRFHFKYTVLELSTAVKPYCLEYIFERYPVDQVIYLDPDIAVYRDLTPLLANSGDDSILLTPHLTAPLTDDRRPSDLDILRSGSYNLGFIAVNRCAESARFLSWWKARLYDHCVVDLPQGLFVDQRWIDLAPGMFGGVRILRHPGLNVAYWNLAHRTVTSTPEGYLVNGEPLYFFHFSGFNPADPQEFSRHQNRLTLLDVGFAKELALDYRKQLYEQGYEECSRWPYAFGRFENGFPIPDMGRPVHHESPAALAKVSDPFSEQGYRAFLEVWNQELAGPDGERSGITRLAYRIYRARPDVQQAMPDIFGRDRLRFLNWVLTSGQEEHRLAEEFVLPALRAVQSLESAAAQAQDSEEELAMVVGEDALTALFQSGASSIAPEGLMEASVLNELTGNGGGRLKLSKLARAIFDSRADLRRRFPDPGGCDSAGFLLWFLTYGAHEYRLPVGLLAPLRAQWDAVVRADGFLKGAWYRTLLPATHLALRLRRSTRRLRNRVRLARTEARFRFAGHPVLAAPQASIPAPWTTNGDGGQAADNLGVSLIGYARSEMGVGESVRCALKAVRASRIAVAVRSVDGEGPYRRGDDFCATESRECSHPVNVFHVNADQAEIVFRQLGPDFATGKYNVGYWAWELEEFPDRWLPAFRYFDEIWTPSTFCQASIAAKSPLPVLRVPHAIDVDCDSRLDRTQFSLPAGRFLFLAFVDLMSIAERKNPLGTLAAFRQACPSASNLHLVLKVNHAQERPAEMAKIAAAAAGLPVTIIDRTIDRRDVNSLIQACDCLVSLHRSEGFGLTIAEAMFLEKPVIVTAYSGNLDFTRPGNSFLVEYDLARVPKGCEPYEEGQVWADPRLDHAAQQILTVAGNADLRAVVAHRAADHIRTHLSPAAVGTLIRQRLELIPSARAASRRALVSARR